MFRDVFFYMLGFESEWGSYMTKATASHDVIEFASEGYALTTTATGINTCHAQLLAWLRFRKQLHSFRNRVFRNRVFRNMSCFEHVCKPSVPQPSVPQPSVPQYLYVI